MSYRNQGPNHKKTITICCSASFYKSALEIEKNLKKMGFHVKVPKTARTMKRTGNFKVEDYKTWFANEKHYRLKKNLMDDHFKKVIESDAILVVNNEKKGVKGYIGGNVLMEMVIAYHYKKPIFVWNPIEKGFQFEEEIIGMGSKIINQDLLKVKI